MSTRNPVGPQGSAALDEGLRHLSATRDDKEVARKLTHRRELVLDANSLEPVANHVYRVDCGHLISIWLCPLPEGQTFLYCGDCQTERRVVEHLT